MQSADTQTTIATETDVNADGFIIIAKISDENQRKIHGLQDKIQQAFPDHKFWFPKAEQLHITFAHIISPDVDYQRNRAELFDEIKANAVAALQRVIPVNLNVAVKFDTVETHQAAIIVKGRDDGTTQRLRREFTENFSLPRQTRRPPTIIHSTIARYHGEYDYLQIKEFVDKLNISLIQHINQLFLIHEKVLFVQEYDDLESFPTSRKNR